VEGLWTGRVSVSVLAIAAKRSSDCSAREKESIQAGKGGLDVGILNPLCLVFKAFEVECQSG
jgi:hypothetical protein